MSRQTTFDKVRLLRVEVDAVSSSDAIAYICDQAAPGKSSRYVVKPYVEFLDLAYRDTGTRRLLNDADLSVADGVALVWAAHFLFAGPRSLGRFWFTLFQIVLAPDRLLWPLPDRAAGVSFTWPMLDEAVRRNLRIFLIGKESENDVRAVSKQLTKRLPKANIVGAVSGIDTSSPHGQVSDAWLAQTRARIAQARPDLVLIGMGFPLQERVCAYMARHLDHGVFVGEGGTFDYESFGGSHRRAPPWMQRLGIEWLWRLMFDPRRLTRQLAVPRFIVRIWQSRYDDVGR